MRPCLDDGEAVRILDRGALLPGDIVAYCDDDGRMVLHRLIGWYRRNGSWRLLLQADSARRPDRGIPRERALGKAVDIPVPLRHRIRATGRYAWFAVAATAGRARGRQATRPKASR